MLDLDFFSYYTDWPARLEAGLKLDLELDLELDLKLDLKSDFWQLSK